MAHSARARDPMIPVLFLAISLAVMPFGVKAAQTVTITVGFGAGGLYQITSQAIAQHMGQYLPGHPTVVVQTKPGAGGLLAANYIANLAPKDGSALAVLGGGNVLEPLFGNEAAQFDPRKLVWLGTIDTAVNLCAVWHTVPVNSLKDAMKREVIAGSTGRGSRTTTYPNALNATLGTKFKIVSGYPGGQELTNALERGEIESYCGIAYSSLVARSPDWLRDKKLRFIGQFGYHTIPQTPEAPLILDLMKNQRDRDAMSVLVIDTLIAWPMVAPGGMPKDAEANLRRAYMQTLKDPGFLQEMARIKFDVNPVPGEKLEAEINRIYSLPKDVIQYAKELSGL
jgi:tripartite-type tricarboxylate transporter receptor subunit TctC